MTAPQEIKIYPCPMPACPWAHLSMPGPAESDGTLAEVFGWGVFAARARSERLVGIEETIKAHLATHPVGEWAIAMAQMDADARAAIEAETTAVRHLKARVAELENLAAGILAKFTSSGEGHRARVGQVQVARWEATLKGDAT